MKYYFSFILFFLFFNVNFAQDSCKINKNEPKNGLEFQIGSLLNLTNFNNYTFSYRYCFNYNSGLRIGLYTNVNEEDDYITQQLDSIYNKPNEYSHNYNLKLSIQYLKSIMYFNKFSLICGGGPFISYSKSESSSEHLYSSFINQYGNKNETFSYGIDFILGVEFRLTENVILSGEYGLSIFKSNSDIESHQNYIYYDRSPNRISRESESGQSDTFSTKGLGVNLGLSVFF